MDLAKYILPINDIRLLCYTVKPVISFPKYPLTDNSLGRTHGIWPVHCREVKAVAVPYLAS